MTITPRNIDIDLSIAFDTLNHNISLPKLDHYDILGVANKKLFSWQNAMNIFNWV